MFLSVNSPASLLPGINFAYFFGSSNILLDSSAIAFSADTAPSSSSTNCFGPFAKNLLARGLTTNFEIPATAGVPTPSAIAPSNEALPLSLITLSFGSKF